MSVAKTRLEQVGYFMRETARHCFGALLSTELHTLMFCSGWWFLPIFLAAKSRKWLCHALRGILLDSRVRGNDKVLIQE